MAIDHAVPEPASALLLMLGGGCNVGQTTNCFASPSNPLTCDSANKSRFLEQVADACRVRHLSYLTEQSYVAWVRLEDGLQPAMKQAVVAHIVGTDGRVERRVLS